MRVQSLDARRFAGLSGLAVAVLFGAGSAIWGLDMPAGGASADEVVGFYRDTADRIVVGATLSLLAVAAFLLFAAALRQVLVEAGADEFLATTAFGGAVLSMAAGIGAESINMVGALRARDDELSGDLASSLFEVSQILGSYASGIGLGVFAAASAAAALRTGAVLPRWLALVLLIAGVALLTPLSRIAVLPGSALVAITLALGVALLRDD